MKQDQALVGGLCPDGFSWGGWCLLTRHCRERERDCENKKDPERAREREGDKPRNTRQDGDTVKHCAPLVVSLAAFFPCWLLRSLLVVAAGGRVVTRDSASACACVYCDEQRKCLFFFSASFWLDGPVYLFAVRLVGVVGCKMTARKMSQ